MQWIVASSTNIEKFRYDMDSLILEIEFKKGTVYQYFDVPNAIYESFVSQVNSGGSAGQYFNSNIKGYYRFARI
jgi:hypothetical protein